MMPRDLAPIAALVLAAVAAGSGPPLRDGTRSLSPAAAVQENGQALFEGKGNCSTCHGKGGIGTPLGPRLTDGEWLNTSPTLEGITGVVTAGVMKPKQFPAPMPPMGGAKLRPAEVDAVARYVLSLSATAGR